MSREVIIVVWTICRVGGLIMGMAFIYGGAIRVIWVIFMYFRGWWLDVSGGSDGVAVVSEFAFVGTMVEMVLVEAVDVVLCVVMVCLRSVFFVWLRISERVLALVRTSHSVYNLGVSCLLC